MKRMLCGTLLLVGVVACGSKSPTQPSPTPTPTPKVPSVTFTSTAGAIAGTTLSLVPASLSNDREGTVSFSVRIDNALGVSKVRGDLLFDGALLEYDGWAHGGFLEQSDAVVDWTWIDNYGRLSLFLDRATQAGGASGNGTIIAFRLKPRAGVTSGSTQIQWNDPVLYNVGFRPLIINRQYGGTVTIQ